MKFTVDEAASGSADAGPNALKKISWIQLIGLAYMYNCGGAYGVEQAVAAAGAFLSVVALVVFGLLWALPQVGEVDERRAAVNWLCRAAWPRSCALAATRAGTRCSCRWHLQARARTHVSDSRGRSEEFKVLRRRVVHPPADNLQAMITAELSTAFPKFGGGSLYWVEAALGRRWALVSAVCLNVGQVFDLAIYPGMITTYAAGLIPALNDSFWVSFAVQAACILIVAAANVLGLHVLSVSSWVMMFITVVPFVIFPIVAASSQQHFDWSAAGPAAMPTFSGASDQNLALFISIYLWAFQGWSSLGNLAAEVENPRKAFPLAMSVLVVMTVVSYAYPIFFGVALHPDLNDWQQEGYWTTLLDQVSSWLGVWVLIGASVANFGSGLDATAIYSRYLAATVREGYLPWVPVLGTTSNRWGTPVPAILLMTLTTLILTNVPFTVILGVDTLFNAISTLMVVASYLRLRYSQPSLRRPYEIPGGKAAAWAISITCFTFVVTAITISAMGSFTDVAAAAGIVALVYALAVWRERSEAGRPRAGDAVSGPAAAMSSINAVPLDVDGSSDARAALLADVAEDEAYR